MTYRLGEPEGIPASPDDDGGEDDGDDDKDHDDVNGAGVYDDDDKENLFIVLRLCRKHDKILSASHTVTPIIQAFLPCHTQSVVNALEVLQLSTDWASTLFPKLSLP